MESIVKRDHRFDAPPAVPVRSPAAGATNLEERRSPFLIGFAGVGMLTTSS